MGGRGGGGGGSGWMDLRGAELLVGCLTTRQHVSVSQGRKEKDTPRVSGYGLFLFSSSFFLSYF